jgi:sigma-B regulation protein RsbU (phosphoserine phosphatase)
MKNDSPFRDLLVVDDSDTIRRYLKVTLERDGYNVRLCSDASEACWEIDARRPDYILSDWHMPTMNGVELCQWVREHQTSQYIYFLLMTAHTRVFDLVDGLDAGADDYVQKPIKINELLARLRCGERILTLERRLRAMAGQTAAVSPLPSQI